jgi:hypothetical protein
MPWTSDTLAPTRLSSQAIPYLRYPHTAAVGNSARGQKLTPDGAYVMIPPLSTMVYTGPRPREEEEP